MKIGISPKANILNTIPMLSPNIGDRSTFSKQSRSSQILVTPEKDNSRSNVTMLVDGKTESGGLQKNKGETF